jgi:hypothetical protein
MLHFALLVGKIARGRKINGDHFLPAKIFGPLDIISQQCGRPEGCRVLALPIVKNASSKALFSSKIFQNFL